MRHQAKFPKLDGRAVLSPMAGVTDVAFRTLCKQYGAALTCTEFVSGTALVRASHKTEQMVVTDPCEKPVAVQLFGSNVNDVVEAARLMAERFDIIDINCGCPAWKVIKTGAGSELLRNPAGIGSFINKIASAIQKPVTVKIRSGISARMINAVEVARVAEDAGAAAIAIHGRTQDQGYAGLADWNIIKLVKDAVSIPVIGNGDVFTPEVFKQRLDESGVDAIMVARGAIGNPYIFTQINEYLKKGTYQSDNRLTHFKEYLALARKYNLPFAVLKTHAMNFTKSIPGGARLREQIMTTESADDIARILPL